jgi:hypothetical protein
MGRILLIAALCYGLGDPGFDGHRPADLDRPLRQLHQTVNTAAMQVQRAVIALHNQVRELPALSAKLRHLSDVLP